MASFPHLQMITPSAASTPLRHAHSDGFSWYYSFPPDSPQSLLTCLGLGVLFHDLMPSETFLDWKDDTWSPAPAVSPVLQYTRGKVAPMNFAAFATEEFWVELGTTVSGVAVKLCEEQDKQDLAERMRSGEVVETEHFAVAVELLCWAMSIELHVYEQVQGEDRVMVKCFNDMQGGVRCYVTVAKDGNTYHYLGHKDFVESRAISAEGEFPFKTQEWKVAAPVQSAAPLQPREPGEQLISTLLRYLQTTHQCPSASPSEFAACVTAYQDYVAYRDSAGLPPLDVELPSTECPSIRTGPHSILDCPSFDPSEAYLPLDCGHQFHTRCIRVHLNNAYCEQKETGQRMVFVCPTCATVLTANTLGKVSELLQAGVEGRQTRIRKYKRCEHCKYARSAEFVVTHTTHDTTHTATHDVCAVCLREKSCPICKHSLTPVDQKLISRCFE